MIARSLIDRKSPWTPHTRRGIQCLVFFPVREGIPEQWTLLWAQHESKKQIQTTISCDVQLAVLCSWPGTFRLFGYRPPSPCFLGKCTTAQQRKKKTRKRKIKERAMILQYWRRRDTSPLQIPWKFRYLYNFFLAFFSILYSFKEEEEE